MVDLGLKGQYTWVRAKKTSLEEFHNSHSNYNTICDI